MQFWNHVESVHRMTIKIYQKVNPEYCIKKSVIVCALCDKSVTHDQGKLTAHFLSAHSDVSLKKYFETHVKRRRLEKKSSNAAAPLMEVPERACEIVEKGNGVAKVTPRRQEPNNSGKKKAKKRHVMKEVEGDLEKEEVTAVQNEGKNEEAPQETSLPTAASGDTEKAVIPKLIKLNCKDKILIVKKSPIPSLVRARSVGCLPKATPNETHLIKPTLTRTSPVKPQTGSVEVIDISDDDDVAVVEQPKVAKSPCGLQTLVQEVPVPTPTEIKGSKGAIPSPSRRPRAPVKIVMVTKQKSAAVAVAAAPDVRQILSKCLFKCSSCNVTSPYRYVFFV